MKDYHINVFFSEEDQAYVAEIPDLKPVLHRAPPPRTPCANF